MQFAACYGWVTFICEEKHYHMFGKTGDILQIVFHCSLLGLQNILEFHAVWGRKLNLTLALL